MATSELTITVQEGDVSARLDDGAESGSSRFGNDNVDEDLIQAFSRWLVDPDRTWDKRDVAPFGSLLYRRLFGGEPGSFFEELLNDLPGSDTLRLQLSFRGQSSARLSALPWEYLYRPDREASPGFFLATHRRLVLSRYTPLKAGRKDLGVEKGRLRMLVVVSKPVDLGEVVEEPVLQAIEDRTEKLPVQVEVLDEPTYDRLSSALGRFRPHLLHYMGHGEYDEDRQTGQIALLRPDGTAWWCGDQQFAEILDRLGDRPRVVVLHACEGAKVDERVPFVGMAPHLVRHGVQAVIAMRYVVTNRTAIEFSGAFYRELFAGKPLDEAAQAARWEISSVGGWGSDARLLGVPVLYLHSRNAVVLPAESAS